VGGDGTRAAFSALFSTYLAVTATAVVLVFLAVLVGLVRGRRRGPVRGGDPSRTELAYLGLLVAIAVGLLAATISTEEDVDATTSSPAVRVHAVASQWRWSFAETAGGSTSRPAGELVVPRGETVLFTLRSADVIHSLWIPEVRFKRYAFPDRETTFDLMFPSDGTFDGLCAQFCGLEHDRMRFTVRVVDRDAFDRWLSGAAS
jgi:cytochrome c oxidase subunit II